MLPEIPMDIEATIGRFSGMAESQQAVVLARFAWELTVLARESYGSGPGGVADARMLREINELQHRVTSAISDRLTKKRERYPDDVLVRMSVGSADSPLTNRTGPLFVRILDKTTRETDAQS